MNCPTCGTSNPDAQEFCGHCGAALRPPSSGDDAPTGFAARQPDALESGTTFAGRYQIIEELGRGGMGRVYKVIDQEVHAKIALKLIRPEIASDQATIDRFRRELHDRPRDLPQEHLPDVRPRSRRHHVLPDDGVRVGRRPEEHDRACRGSSASAPRSASRSRCATGSPRRTGWASIHRDLKPQNIQIDKGGQAKIMDFGIARSVGGQGPDRRRDGGRHAAVHVARAGRGQGRGRARRTCTRWA